MLPPVRWMFDFYCAMSGGQLDLGNQPNSAVDSAWHKLKATFGTLDSFSPMAKVTAATSVFPDKGLLRFLLRPKSQTMSENKLHFPL